VAALLDIWVACGNEAPKQDRSSTAAGRHYIHYIHDVLHRKQTKHTECAAQSTRSILLLPSVDHFGWLSGHRLVCCGKAGAVFWAGFTALDRGNVRPGCQGPCKPPVPWSQALCPARAALSGPESATRCTSCTTWMMPASACTLWRCEVLDGAQPSMSCELFVIKHPHGDVC
jgi:hypothetical protein